MKDFDIEKAKAGAPVCTREGRKVRIVCFDVKGDKYPILALAENPNGVDEDIMWYTRDGKYYDHELDFGQSVNDLMMATIKHEGWVNIFKHETSRNDFDICGPIFPDDETAKNNVFHPDKRYNYITTIHIEWEE